MDFLSKVHRQRVDEQRFFHIVGDDKQCGGSIEAVSRIMGERLSALKEAHEDVEL
jgi:hypothetical protein